MQTSFMHPPFGFALFYLRSVAPNEKYVDRLTRKPIEPVTTGQIYWGAVPFVIIQLIMVAIVITWPRMVTDVFGDEKKIDIDKVKIELESDQQPESDPLRGLQPEESKGKDGEAKGEEKKAGEEDPTQAILRSLGQEKK
jgi:GntP family gluconate:H+ symporter